VWRRLLWPFRPNAFAERDFGPEMFGQACPTICRALTLDVFSGTSTRDYACGFKTGDTIPTPAELSRFFGYLFSMRRSAW
jgi:hypothetical protein